MKAGAIGVVGVALLLPLGASAVAAPCSSVAYLTGQLFGWANATFAETTDFYVDDVVLSTSYIGPGSSTSHEPAAPANLRVVSQT